MKRLVYIAMLLCAPLIAAEQDFSSTQTKIEKAISAESRSDKDRARDNNRYPLETLQFFGLRDNMKVIELIPGGGWYSQILAPVLADSGDFSVAIGTSRVEKMIADNPSLKKVKVLKTNDNIRREKGDRFYSIDAFDFGQNDVDIVFTFRNYHNFNEQGRRNMNEAVFKALKPGGIYAVVDHTRRHMEPLNNENGRRVDPLLAIKEIQQAGFMLLDYTDLHYRADDELRFEVGRKTVTGNTDRFTIKFVKPE